MESSDLPVYGIGVRHGQVALIFLMVVVMYSINMAPPVSIVAMTDPNTSPNPDIPTFNWTDQSLVLSSFYWGFAPTQILGGPLARKYGYKWFMVVSMIIASLFSIWLPALVIKFGSKAMIVCLVIQGLVQGLIIPMLSDFISKWAPITERTTIGTFILASKTLGTVLATEIAGLLGSSSWGWPSTFYTYGFLGILWSIFMIVLGCDNPNEHKSITQAELDYIKRGITFTKKKVPWPKILKSGPAWSTWITQIGLVWTIRLTTTEFPTYINRVLGFPVNITSNFLSVTYLFSYLNTFVVSTISQYDINHNYATIGNARKVCNSIASWGSALILILLATSIVDRYWALGCIFVLFLFTNASYSGFNINYNDLSPNYAGCLSGVGGIASTAISFVPLLLAQLLVTNQASATEWGHAFIIAAVITSLCNIPFVIKGSGDVQEWDDDIETNEDEESRVLLENKATN